MHERLFSQLNSLYLQQACHARSMVPSGRFRGSAGAARIGSGSAGAAAADGRKGAGALPGAGVGDAAGESRVEQTKAPGVHFSAYKCS